MATAVAAKSLLPALFLQAQFKSGMLYVWSGFGSYSWGGHTYIGVGSLGSISTVEESTNVEAKGITLNLSGIDPTLLTDVLTDFKLGTSVVIYLGLFNRDGSMIADPVISWAGRMDQPSIDVGAETATISINCENRLFEMNTAVDRRYTNEDQRLDHADDRGFEFVNAIQELNIYWGRTATNTNTQ
jgi:hypothetical protein